MDFGGFLIEEPMAGRGGRKPGGETRQNQPVEHQNPSSTRQDSSSLHRHLQPPSSVSDAQSALLYATNNRYSHLHAANFHFPSSPSLQLSLFSRWLPFSKFGWHTPCLELLAPVMIRLCNGFKGSQARPAAFDQRCRQIEALHDILCPFADT